MKIDGSSVDSVLMSCVLYMMCFLRGRRGWDIWSLAVPTVSAGTADGKQNPVVQPGSSFLYMPQNNTLLWHFILQFATCLCSTFQHAKWDKMSGLMMLDLESLPFTFLWQCPWVPWSFHIKSLEHKVVNTSLSLSIYCSKQGCHMMTRNTSCLNTEILLCWFPKSPISGCSSSSLVSSSVCVCVCVLSLVQISVTPWTIAHQTPWSMEFSKQEYWSMLPLPSPGDLPDSGIKPVSPALVDRFYTSWGISSHHTSPLFSS